MSLIVARKDSNHILIVNDTKLSFPDEHKSSQRQKRSPSDGVLKSTIINDNICVSFAGGVDYAQQALQQLSPDNSVEEVLKTLLAWHITSNTETDFIVSVGLPSPKIFEIKNRICMEAETSWIGSPKAFDRFQGYMLGTIEKKQASSFITIEPSLGSGTSTVFGKMSKAMDSVIEDEDIPEVDGFKVNVVFDDKGAFRYSGYTHSYRSSAPIAITLPLGVKSMTFPISHHTAAEGGYTINFFNSSNNATFTGLHIRQGDFGIIYEKKGGGLLWPFIIKEMDEVDFVDYAKEKYGIYPLGTTQNKGLKYSDLGDKSFQSHDFVQAIVWYNKSLVHVQDKLKAQVYYRKGVALINTNRVPEALLSFQEAIKLDYRYQQEAFNLMQQVAQNRASRIRR